MPYKRCITLIIKIILSLLFVFLHCINIYSQESYFTWKGTIYEKDGKTVSNAHIQIFSDGRVFLFTADEKGKVNIEYYLTTLSDSILITSIGYQPLKLACSELKKITEIQLEDDIYSINEVVIKPDAKKKRKTIKLGNTEAFALGTINGMANFQYTLYISHNIQANTILSIRYYIGSVMKIIDSQRRPFRVRLYEKDTINDTVGKDLLNDILIASPDKMGWFEVDISQYGIIMPKQGVFAGFEILSTEHYSKKNITKDDALSFSRDTRMNTVTIGWTHQKKGTLIEKWWYNPFADKWSQGDGPPDWYYLINIEVEKND